MTPEESALHARAETWHAPEEYLTLHTIGDFIRWCSSAMTRHQLYFGHGSDNAWDEATFLVLSAVAQPLDSGPELLHLRLVPSEKHQIARWLQKRVEDRLPLPYITGEAWFAGRAYTVTPDVLIPRSPFAEILADHCAPWLEQAPERILDMCTGSGCIGIAAAHEFPGALVDLVDISDSALQVARKNIARHQVGGRVRALESDGFDALAGQTYDLILANPPYVDAEDLADMPVEYHREPAQALGSGTDGLDLTRRLLQQARQHLNPGGLLFIEVGNSAAALEQAFPTLPMTWVELEQGGHGIAVIAQADLP
ncbi:MAG: 50S ribosomal protein L3 N(5)-glutamine methyltransferase [Natronospirillum sp.]|uniref:50S ribosomal protein L3 N(5)-glutamine methyltransferase n=1 Tax=Natronospirillum sp. TaxID=2812955 RepID=UPI0025CC8351|nr:50S ribosomal protein L3 N(5)-glutamine methyltransferase [Natronospirillum sp.]MCH8551309.1 50S ribosomal protein L3 N(5)-glutamine methyltransferase [Natronospirillum sp.]